MFKPRVGVGRGGWGGAVGGGGHLTPKRVGVRVWVNFHSNQSIRGVNFNPNRNIKFSQKLPQKSGQILHKESD